jgi:hypothetical protein
VVVEGLSTSLLLFFVDDDLPPDADAAIERAVAEMAPLRDWTVGPPEFVDQHHDDGARTIGGVLTLYAPQTVDGRDLPLELDRRLLNDARAFVDRVVELSRATGVTFGFELDQDSTGWVTNGEPDTSVTIGLIGEWERVLESRA